MARCGTLSCPSVQKQPRPHLAVGVPPRCTPTSAQGQGRSTGHVLEVQMCWNEWQEAWPRLVHSSWHSVAASKGHALQSK